MATGIARPPVLWRFSRKQAVRQQAVIDIGSNSVRLLVYQIDGRSVVPRLNEKVMAGLGRGLAETGRLSPEGVEAALTALSRYAAICSSLGVDDVTAIATAATREAEDGDAFCEEIERVSGFPVRVLSGAEEAHYAALGVVAGQGAPTGLIGDLGGSSLELITTDAGELTEGKTYKLGPFALQAFQPDEKTSLSSHVKKVLKAQGGVPKCRNFYTVGGAWRAIASIHMALNNYPLQVLQSYIVPASEMISLCKLLMDAKKRPEDVIRSVAGKRTPVIEYAALTLKTVLEMSKAENVVVSANGVREGLVFSGMEAETQRLDPLFAGVARLARQDSRQAGFTRELHNFSAEILSALPPVFGDDRAAEDRLHEAAFLLADIGATMHPDHRSDIARQIVLRGPYSGADHPARIYLGLVTAIRYWRKFTPTELETTALTPEQIDRAKTVALIIRLAAEFSGRTERILKRASLGTDDGKLVLTIQKRHQNLMSDGVRKRLGHLASQLNLEAEIR